MAGKVHSIAVECFVTNFITNRLNRLIEMSDRMNLAGEQLLEDVVEGLPQRVQRSPDPLLGRRVHRGRRGTCVGVKFIISIVISFK